MGSSQSLGTADTMFVGKAYDPGVYEQTQQRGAPATFLTKVNLGSPVAAVANAFIKAATSTELPNNATKTYQPSDGVASPLDSASLPTTTTIIVAGARVTVWKLDVPRALAASGTHASAFVATTIKVWAFDQYKRRVTQTLALSGTTTAAAAGKKAVLYIEKIEITSAGNATTNTINVGWNDVLGLPWRLQRKSDLLSVWFNDAADATPTVVLGDATTPSLTTGDVRGTIDPTSACDGSRVEVWMHVADTATSAGLRGLMQYSS